MASAVDQQVRERARERCDETPFQIDHVIAKKHGGKTVPSNLAYACYHCNLHKGPNIASLDPPGTGELVRLFNPRTDDWSEHFEWHGAEIHGRTSIARATILVLNMNDPAAVAVRVSLMTEGVEFA